MIRWAAPQLLYLLLAIPVLAVLMMGSEWLKRRSLAQLADAALVPRLTDSRSPRLAALKAACMLLGLALVFVAAARPQWGEKLQVVHGRGIDVVVVLDASKSMLATDVNPNRLQRSKTEIASLLDNLGTDRVGIVAFAGDAQVMCPLTPDVEAAKLFLDIIEPDNMPRPGTNIQRAIETAASVFDPQDASSKALVLVTDGDNLDGDLATATRVAIADNIRIFAVGVGTPEGSTIPESGASGTSYKKDKDDKIVVSRLAERQLLVMARATDGRYFRSESINLDNLVAALDQIHKKSFGGGDYVEYEERYQAFLLAGFILLFSGILFSDRRGAWFTGLRWPRIPRRDATRGARLAVLVAAALLALAAPSRADVGSLMRRGDALERQGKYDLAVKAYQDALVLEPDNVRIHYDIGRALSRMNQQPEAIEHFQLGVLSKKRDVRANSLYNMGNCQYRQQKLAEAIAMYTQALLVRPNDLEAKQNLEFCLKKQAEQKQKPDSTGKQPPPQQQQQPRQQQQPEQQQQQARQQQGAISKDEASRMLQALQGKERENRKQQPRPPQQSPAGGKDW